MADAWLETEARAKVNLRLRIFPRGSDGFHPLETIFCRIDFADRLRLRLREDPGVTIRVSGSEPAPAGLDNLAARAAESFVERCGSAHGVEIELEKRIPAGSGLGGGSSDAAAVLRLIDRALGSPLPHAELLRTAAELGSDVPFFAVDTPLALGRGRGERLQPCAGLETRPLLLLLPDLHVSTGEAYALWDTDHGDGERTPVEPHIGVAAPGRWVDVAAYARNDFEPLIFRRYPLLESLKARLNETRPLVALLSGSGSALFAFYDTDRLRDEALRRLGGVVEGVRVVSASGPL